MSYKLDTFDYKETQTINEFKSIANNRLVNGKIDFYKFKNSNKPTKHPSQDYFGEPKNILIEIIKSDPIKTGLKEKNIVVTPDKIDSTYKSSDQINKQHGLIRLIGDLSSIITYEGAYSKSKSNDESKRTMVNVFDLLESIFKHNFMDYFYINTIDVNWHKSQWGESIDNSYFIFDKYGKQLVIIHVGAGQ